MTVSSRLSRNSRETIVSLIAFDLNVIWTDRYEIDLHEYYTNYNYILRIEAAVRINIENKLPNDTIFIAYITQNYLYAVNTCTTG